MKKIFLYLLSAVILLFGACNDPIFYEISKEVKILPPQIPGSPTNFVNYDNELYVASRRTLYKYLGTNPNSLRGRWEKIPHTKVPSNRRIFQLAVSGSPARLYAVHEISGGNVRLTYYDGTDFINVDNNTGFNFKKIYAANDELFIGAEKDGDYHILHFDGTNFTASLANTGDELITGAAFGGGNYYLSAKNDRNTSGNIYYANSPTGTFQSIITDPDEEVPFMGIINLGGSNVAAIARNGQLYKVTTTSVDPETGISMGNHRSTGALAVWTDGTESFLLAGRQERFSSSSNSGYDSGYMELEIDAAGTLIGSSFKQPGTDFPTSAEHYNRHSIGKYPVNHIFHLTDTMQPTGETIIFASTQNKGVWSYRDRGSGERWNTE